jgi:hypothetical protein
LAHYNGGTKSGKAVAAGQEAPYEETKGYLQKVNSRLKVNPEEIQWSDMKEPSSSVTVSAPNPEDITWNTSNKLDTSKMSSVNDSRVFVLYFSILLVSNSAFIFSDKSEICVLIAVSFCASLSL